LPASDPGLARWHDAFTFALTSQQSDVASLLRYAIIIFVFNFPLFSVNILKPFVQFPVRWKKFEPEWRLICSNY
jgi:hypothetical protein